MAESINGLKRTHYAGKISTQQIGKKVTVMGWVQKRRDHGGSNFLLTSGIDLVLSRWFLILIIMSGLLKRLLN